MSKFVLIGPGRAGMSVALAAQRAGHSVVGVLGRTGADAAAARLACERLDWDGALPSADFTIVAVRDDAIAEVAARLTAPDRGVVMHLSGLKSLESLAPMTAQGARPGSFHPLQTLPDPERGAAALTGCAVAITAEIEDVADQLTVFAHSLGAIPFRLADERKPLYHAAAATASNYVIAVLALAHDLFEAAGVDPMVARPLVSAVVDNVFDVGPRVALTGPIARGDVGTVRAQRAAVAVVSERLEEAFVAMGRMTADLAGTTALMADTLDGGTTHADR